MNLQTAIVEDSKPDAERLKQLLKKAFENENISCSCFASGDEFLRAGWREGYQVVFLDICMEGTNGIETAQRLRAADPDLLIVFVTSSPEYVWDAFPVHPFDYLLKPYKEEKFEQLAGELRRVLCRQQPELEVRIARQIVRLPLTKIYYATAQNHYVRVVTDDGECRATANFAQVQEQLQTQPEFLVCNRGVIINMSKVLRFEGDCMPKEIGVILMNRIRIIAVLAVSISLLGIFLLLYEMYRVAKEYARSSQLDRENQLLAVESRRYMELRSYLEQTRHLRHDFRQHLHVISGLTEAGRLDELKSYLSQYESELSDARPTLCVNAAVDALAGHYDYEARKQGIQIEWKLELPKLLPLPEADLCTILGNLLENALHASQKLPPEERQVKVLARMLSPAMMGLMVENRYDGVLKKQGGVLHSTKHDGQGIGLVSVETAVHRYHGNLTVETGGNVFRANVLLNL